MTTLLTQLRFLSGSCSRAPNVCSMTTRSVARWPLSLSEWNVSNRRGGRNSARQLDRPDQDCAHFRSLVRDRFAQIVGSCAGG